MPVRFDCKRRVAVWGLCALLLLPVWRVAAETSPPLSPLDIAEGFAKGKDSRWVLEQSLLGATQVPIEHLGVAIYDTRQGHGVEITPQALRQLMGVQRANGVDDLIARALPLLSGQPALSQARLQKLTAAAYIASMRQPPDYIEVEFYDRRRGPTGKGDGPSGKTPDQPYQPDEPDRMAQKPHHEGEPASAAVPGLKALKAKMQQLGLHAKNRDGLFVLPVSFRDNGQGFDPMLQVFAADAQRSGVRFERLIHPPVQEQAAGITRYYALIYVRLADPADRQRHKRLFPEYYP